MTGGDEEGRESDRHDEIVAAEYVLGVLDHAARREAESRLMREPAFAALVRRWEADFSALNDEYEPAAPPAAAFARIERRLFASPGAASAEASAPSAGWWNSLALWRGLAFASMIAVVGLAAALSQFGGGRPAPSASPLLAELSASGSPISLVALYDASRGTVRLTPVAARADAAPKSLELWLIEGNDPPVPLGLVPADGRGEIEIAPEKRARFKEGAVLAISLEPEGGSPTGAPTGPVVAAGPARPI